MTELCGRCGCGLTGHAKRPCDNTGPEGERCPCPVGIRADVYACMQLSEIGKTLAKQLILQEAVAGHRVVIEGGKVSVRPIQQGLVIAR